MSGNPWMTNFWLIKAPTRCWSRGSSQYDIGGATIDHVMSEDGGRQKITNRTNSDLYQYSYTQIHRYARACLSGRAIQDLKVAFKLYS